MSEAQREIVNWLESEAGQKWSRETRDNIHVWFVITADGHASSCYESCDLVCHG